MSQAEITARSIYDQMHLWSVSDEVKRHLMILLLSSPLHEEENRETVIPSSLEEAMSMGAVDLETARKELHAYVNELTEKYDLQ